MTSCLVSSASALAAPAAGVMVIMGIMTLPCSERSNGLRSHTESMSQASLGLQGLPCGLSLPPVLICYPLPSSPLATPASLPFLTPARYALTWGLCASFSFCLEYSPSRYLHGFPNLILLQVFAQLSPSQRDFLTTPNPPPTSGTLHPLPRFIFSYYMCNQPPNRLCNLLKNKTKKHRHQKPLLIACSS